VFARVSSTSFGGGTMPSIRREIVRSKRWLSDDEYLELLALAQLLPGSNPTNIAVLIGQRLAGAAGASAALAASIVPGFVILMLIGIAALATHQPWVGGALRGCAAMAVGLTLANTIEMSVKRQSLAEAAIVVAVAAAVIFAHLSLALTLLLFVPIAFVLTRSLVAKR
jgi:chromate transporter